MEQYTIIWGELFSVKEQKYKAIVCGLNIILLRIEFALLLTTNLYLFYKLPNGSYV